MNTVRNERGEITTVTTEIQRIVRNYYEELYAKKFENLDEMDTFLEKYNLPKLNCLLYTSDAADDAGQV